MTGGTQASITSDPRTIWSLGDDQRPTKVMEIIKACAHEFNDAVKRKDAGDAQDMAIHALASVVALFPDPNSDVQKMFQSLCGVFLSAKWGVRKHFLLHSSRPISGMRKGLGHALLGGFAISAVQLLTEAAAISDREARKVIAQILADARCSFRVGDHQEAKPITGAAIRNWIENPIAFEAQHEIASDMAGIHVENLKRRGAATKDQIIEYFRCHAQEMVEMSRII